MIGVIFVIAGLLCAVIVVALAALRGIRQAGSSAKWLLYAALAAVLLIAKFDADPTAVQCATKQTAGGMQHDAQHRCRFGQALGYAMASGGVGLEMAMRHLIARETYSEKSRTELGAEIKRAIVKLSPVVVGFILLLASALALARPFDSNSWVARGALRRAAAMLLVTVSCLGTMPWAGGIVGAYLSLGIRPEQLYEAWLAGVLMGTGTAFVVIDKMMKHMLKSSVPPSAMMEPLPKRNQIR